MNNKKNFHHRLTSSAWWQGVIVAIPIVLGYLPVGFAFGVLAQKAGVSPLYSVLMSLVVFAGSAQLIAVGLIGAQNAPLAIILTTFIVNLRHMLFSTAIFPYIANWRRRELAFFAFELTDETFALHSTRSKQEFNQKAEVFAINITAHLTWIIGTGLGVFTGHRVAEVELLGLDFVLPAMFIALLIIQVKRRTHMWAAIFAGGTSVLLLWLGINQWHVIVATLIGATIGAWIEGWKSI